MAAPSGALRELVAYLGFDLDEGKLDRAEKRVDGLKGKSESLTKALELVGLALGAREIGEFIHSQIEMGNQLAHTSEVLGVSTDELQRFQYAANIADVSADSATTALGFLNKAIGHAGEGNAEAAATFAKLHVQLKNADGSARPLSQVISDVADGMAKLPDHGAKTVAAVNLFGRAGKELIPLLDKGRAGIEGLYGEFDKLGGGLSDEFVHDAEEAAHETKKLNFATKTLSSEIGVVLLPIVSSMAEGVTDVAVGFREWAKGTHFVRNAMIALGVIAGVLVVLWGIMNIEILLVVAALALLALAVDDAITFFEGGDSLLGRFLDKLYGLGASKDIAKQLKDAWKEVSDAFGKLWDAVKQLGPSLADLFATFTDKKGDVNDAKTGIQALADTVKGLADHLTNAINKLNELVKGFDDFAKKHPLLVHAAQRSLHQVGQGNVGVGGALRALGGDFVEAVSGDTSIETDQEKIARLQNEISIPKANAQGEYSTPTTVQQHNETHITLTGLPSTNAAADKLAGAVTDAQTDANNAAFAGTAGGGAP